ncbi:hypothetical protein LOTGIDRAFT_158399 [Lottia gigantea]|uniref:DNA-directed DNA polymerase n=1 Tax=Lottia gigantea TaxID=225164 RepID=V4A5V8_LOTGI|nr:hypothetical protein LOTGIDRAFT_158399 [Lottia gigantea]ESO99318.1 hypothetical protein LOTGIDRAFT_158399 [Lottia gigantea]
MSDLNSEYLKAESGRPFLPEENEEFVKLFNEQKFRPRTAILKVWFKYPTNMFFQPIPAKDIITFTNREEGYILPTHLWSEASLKDNFDSHIKSYHKVNETQYIVEREEEEKEISETKSTTRLTPSHLGSFVLSHRKKVMNNFIHVIDGFYKPEIYYTDTDSLYISSSNWEKLNEAGLVSENDYTKGKNDYGDGGIIFGLYLAPKIKYNIILTSDGILKEKKTFKGYSKDKISVEDFNQLASGHDVMNEFKKKMGKKFHKWNSYSIG